MQLTGEIMKLFLFSLYFFSAVCGALLCSLGFAVNSLFAVLLGLAIAFYSAFFWEHLRGNL